MKTSKIHDDKVRVKWGSGPWQSEPDKAQWIHAGLDCLIVRNDMGALCGYVGVPNGHPLHGKDYDQAHDLAEIDVHGGLTYARDCAGKICHVPEQGRPDHVWWLGFDCAHLGDFVPSSNSLRSFGLSRRRDEVYRDLAYVKAEVERLADQFAGLKLAAD